MFATPVKEKRVSKYVHHHLSENLKEAAEENENLNSGNDAYVKVKIPAVAINPTNQHMNIKNPEIAQNSTINKAPQSNSM